MFTYQFILELRLLRNRLLDRANPYVRRHHFNDSLQSIHRDPYNYQDQTIKSVGSQSPPKQLSLDIEDFRTLWALVFNPRVSENNTAASGAVKQLSWMAVGSRSGSREYLRNFLAFNLQFGSTAAVWANSSIQLEPNPYPILPEMAVTATAGTLVQRFVAQPWTVWVFIVTGSVLTTLCGAALLYIVLRQRPVPKRSGIPEFDVFSDPTMGRHVIPHSDETTASTKFEQEVALGRFLVDLPPDRRTSLMELGKLFKGKRIVARPESEGENSRVLIIRTMATAKRSKIPEGSADEIAQRC